jgi:hypothetical protein
VDFLRAITASIGLSYVLFHWDARLFEKIFGNLRDVTFDNRTDRAYGVQADASPEPATIATPATDEWPRGFIFYRIFTFGTSVVALKCVHLSTLETAEGLAAVSQPIACIA